MSARNSAQPTIVDIFVVPADHSPHARIAFSDRQHCAVMSTNPHASLTAVKKQHIFFHASIPNPSPLLPISYYQLKPFCSWSYRRPSASPTHLLHACALRGPVHSQSSGLLDLVAVAPSTKMANGFSVAVSHLSNKNVLDRCRVPLRAPSRPKTGPEYLKTAALCPI